MVATESYKDICKDIDQTYEYIEILQQNYSHYFRLLQGKAPTLNNMTSSIKQDKVMASNPYMSPGEAYKKCVEIDIELKRILKSLEMKEKFKVEIETEMDDIDHLGKKIRYMFKVKNMSLTEISNKLGYSYTYCKRLSHEYKQEVTKR